MSKINEILREVFIGRRGAGSTTALMEGVLNTPNCLVGAANEAHKDQLKQRYPEAKVIVLRDPNILKGVHSPILLDHYTLETLWCKREAEILAFKQEIKHKLGKMTSEIFELIDEI